MAVVVVVRWVLVVLAIAIAIAATVLAVVVVVALLLSWIVHPWSCVSCCCYISRTGACLVYGTVLLSLSLFECCDLLCCYGS